MMYADHLNDHVYGLMVPRDYAGNLVLSEGYKIFKTRGNSDEAPIVSTHADGNTVSTPSGFTEDCNVRRINVIYV